jgi:hypothetical protein
MPHTATLLELASSMLAMYTSGALASSKKDTRLAV